MVKPHVAFVVKNWVSQVTIKKFDTRSVSADGIVGKAYTIKDIKGIFQPMNNRHLMFRPEGVQAWWTHTLHTVKNYKLTNEDIVIRGDIEYRIVDILDASDYGYWRYGLVELVNE